LPSLASCSRHRLRPARALVLLAAAVVLALIATGVRDAGF
jgi:hypothetical protein